MARPDVVLDINGLDGLSGIEARQDGLEIGALVRQKAALRSDDVRRACPLLADALEYVGHPETRNRGTLCGSLAHADPAAELPAVVAALDGSVVLRSATGSREVTADEFFVTWFTTSREPDELVTSVRLPAWQPGSGWSFQELARRHHEFALVAVAAIVILDSDGGVARARLAFAGVGPTSLRARTAEGMLQGEQPSQSLVASAAEQASRELEPASDVHASAAYRRHLAKVLAGRALAQALERTGAAA